MNILAHRGAWDTPDEKNTVQAIKRAFSNGWGIETDVRDYCGKLVISHDIASEDSPLLTDILSVYKEVGMESFLAINIKADGIQSLLMNELEEYEISNYAVFDMSIPEQVVYKKMNIPFFTRQSEIETYPVMYDDAAGVWMDEWEKAWIDRQVICGHLEKGKVVGIISPEIHGRDYQILWEHLKKIDSDRLFLCTDIPKEAVEVFCGND